jgi:hypothetical protein
MSNFFYFINLYLLFILSIPLPAQAPSPLETKGEANGDLEDSYFYSIFKFKDANPIPPTAQG